MKAYVVRRLLLMIPTFFGISLVIFAVLNLAPGRPGQQQSADLARNAKNEETEESYRIFREQFSLDKPIFWNTRFLLSDDAVRSLVRVAANVTRSSAAERIHADEDLEDFGEYAVPHLIAIMNDADRAHDVATRDAAVYFLRLDATRPLEDPFAKSQSAATRAHNASVESENADLRKMRYPLDA